MHKNSKKPCYERVAQQDAMQMILIMRVKNSTNQRNTNHTFGMCIALMLSAESNASSREVCCYEKFESPLALAAGYMALYGAGKNMFGRCRYTGKS